MKKRTLSLFLSLQLLAGATTFTFQPGINVDARTPQNSAVIAESQKLNKEEAQIATIFQCMSQLNVDSQIHPENTFANTAKIAQYDAQLAELGVNEMDPDDVQDLPGNAAQTYSRYTMTCPSSTQNVKWWDKKETVTYNNVKYSIQLVYAQNLNGKSSLAFGTDSKNITLYKDKNFSVSKIKTLASIYVQKAIGLVPIVQWTPYELLFSESESKNVTCDKHLVTYRGNQTVCFGYAAKASSPKDQDLALVTNSISVAATQTFAGYKSGRAFTKSHDYSFTSTASKYGSAYQVAKEANTKSGFDPHEDFVETISMGVPDPSDLSKVKKIKIGTVPAHLFPAQISNG